jgi:hypothetical protein
MATAQTPTIHVRGLQRSYKKLMRHGAKSGRRRP